jgi:hypothetical protein
VTRPSLAAKAARFRLQRELEPHGLHYLLDELWAEDGLPIGVLAERLGIEVATIEARPTRA